MIKIFVCTKCKKTFEKKSDYKIHIQQNHCFENVLKKCEYCLNKFNKLELKKHLADQLNVCYFKLQKHLEDERNLCYFKRLYEKKQKEDIIIRAIEDKVDKLTEFYLNQNYAHPQKQNKRKKYSNRVRNLIGSRQKWCCANCSEMFGPVWHVDHVIPLVSKEDNIENENNLQGLCVNCHALKTNQEGIKYNF